MNLLLLTLLAGLPGPSLSSIASSTTASSTVSVASTSSTSITIDLPASQAAVEVASPLSTPATIQPERTSFWDKLRFTGLVLSTARWQLDNGDRTQPFIEGEEGLMVDNNWDPTGENFGDLVTTVGGSVGYENLLLAARFDSALYFRRPQAHPDASKLIERNLADRYVNLFRAEYLAATYTDRDVEITFGDSYITLGRGMILSLRKAGDVGVDNKLRGAKVTVRAGGWRFLVARGWVNGKNYEAGTGYYYPERLNAVDRPADERPYEANDLVSAGRVAYRFGKMLEIGAHASHILTPTEQRRQSELLGTGATVELPRPLKWLSAYLEFAHLRRDDSRLNQTAGRRPERSGILSGDVEKGYGLYGSSSLYLGPVTVLIEGKFYDNMFNVFPRGIRQPVRGVINRYSEPPTAERPLSLLLANNTVVGGRTRVDYRVAPGIVPYLSGGIYRDDSFGRNPNGVELENQPPTNVWALFGGGRFSFGHTELVAETGYRLQTNDYGSLGPATEGDAQEIATEDQRRADLDGSVFRTDLHLLVDWVQPIWGPLATELVINGLYAVQGIGASDCDQSTSADVEECDDRGNQRFVDIKDEWFEGRVALSLKSSDGWGVTGAWEFYTRQPQRFDQHYFSFGGQWEFKKGSILRALYGGERAGLKCSGGVCRFFPGFEGGRLELVVRL